MSKKEAITRQLDQLPEHDLDRLLAFLRALRGNSEEQGTTLPAESALAKDWLAPEEDAAWANL